MIKSIYIQGVPRKKTKCASISLKYTMMKLFIFNNFNNVSKILTKKEKKKFRMLAPTTILLAPEFEENFLAT